jgi:hypothetical protein
MLFNDSCCEWLDAEFSDAEAFISSSLTSGVGKPGRIFQDAGFEGPQTWVRGFDVYNG